MHWGAHDPGSFIELDHNMVGLRLTICPRPPILALGLDGEHFHWEGLSILPRQGFGLSTR